MLSFKQNRQLPSSIDTTELPGTKQRNSPCNTNTDLPGAENCDVNYHDASNTDKFSETSGRTHLAAHNYSPQICNDNTNGKYMCFQCREIPPSHNCRLEIQLQKRFSKSFSSRSWYKTGKVGARSLIESMVRVLD